MQHRSDVMGRGVKTAHLALLCPRLLLWSLCCGLGAEKRLTLRPQLQLQLVKLQGNTHSAQGKSSGAQRQAGCKPRWVEGEDRKVKGVRVQGCEGVRV